MRNVSRNTLTVIICMVSMSVLAGCTNWQKKYETLNVEHQNLKGLLERERAEKGQLAGQVTKEQQTIDELQKKIAQRKQTPAVASGFGEGYEVAVDAEAGTVTVTLPNAILFDSGKAVLKRSASTDLNHVLGVLKREYSSRQIDIVGNTDSDPIKKSQWKDNWELSAERALTVVRYMTEHGIPKEKIRAIGRGDSQPIASNATASGKSRNSRVEVVVHMK